MTDPTAAVDLWNGTTDAKAVYWTDLEGKLTQDAPEIAGHSHSMDESAITHIRKHHGDVAAESSRGQIAITGEDIARIPELVTDYDAIRTDLRGHQGEQRIAYTKHVDDGLLVYVEEASGKRHNMRAVTMRKFGPQMDAQTALERTIKELAKQKGPNLNDSTPSDDVARTPFVYETNARPAAINDDPTTGGEFSQGGIDTNSAAFKTWFGDSKIVDENGEPLEVHHGTGAIIEAFDPSFTGKGNDQMGSGFYFTDLKETAGTYETYTNIRNEDKPGGTDNPNTVTAYLSIKNPIVLSVEEDTLQKVKVTQKQAAEIMLKSPDVFDAEKSPLVDWVDNGGKRFTKRDVLNIAENYEDSFVSLENDFFRGNATAFREAVHAVMGYDGVIKTFPSGEKHFVAWFPTQIKSVNNRGTFNPNDPNIFYQALNPNVDPDQKIKVVDLSGTKPLHVGNQKDANAFVNKWKGAPLEIGTDTDGNITVRLSKKDPDHPFWSSEWSGRKDTTRRAALADLDKVLARAVRIEDTTAKHKGVDQTIRFYVPVVRGNSDPVALRIVAHEMAGQKAEIDGVELYDIIRERPYPSGGKPVVGGTTGRSPEITIREMLSGVKDANGNHYFQSQPPRGGFNPETLTTILYKEADFSTFVHETSHFFLDTYARMASDPNAPQAIKDDMNTICRSKRVGCSGQK